MGDQTGGMGAEVGVRKMNDDGKVVQKEGIADDTSRTAWTIFMIMVFLSGLGLWKLFEIVLMLL